MSGSEWAYCLAQFLFGIIFLVIGSSGLVEGASAIAHRLRIRPLIIGLTVVAFGTSAPELFVTTGAVLRHSSGVAVGNVIGSNIANLGLILAVVALIRPLRFDPKELIPQFFWMFGIYLLFSALFFWKQGIGRIEGAILFLALVAYLFYSYKVRLIPEDQKVKPAKFNILASLMFLLTGIFLLCIGADWLVKSGIKIAKALGVSELVIGLSMIAIGTSLPELAVSVYAGIKKKTAISVGNLIGSNIFNISGVIGIACLVRPIAMEFNELAVHILVMFGIAVVLPIFSRDYKISRWEALILLLGFIAFVGYIYLQKGGIK